MSIYVERSIYTAGTLVKIRSIPISGDAVALQGHVGIITKTPVPPGNLYEVCVGEEFVWLTQSEMSVVRDCSLSI